ncbi:protein S100-A1-like [Dugong dugon]
MPQCLLRSIINLINVFHNHTKSDGDCQRLSKMEVKKLLQQEFGVALEKTNNSETTEKLLQQLDQGGGKTVDFTEFILLVFRVTRAYYACIKPLLCSEGEPRNNRRNQIREQRSAPRQYNRFQGRDQIPTLRNDEDTK